MSAVSDPLPYCKYGHYEEWDGLPECVNEMTADHENHERLVEGCAECDAEMAEAQRLYGKPHPRGYSGDEQREMEADRELMRDEFHR